jgi:hypothetical protein
LKLNAKIFFGDHAVRTKDRLALVRIADHYVWPIRTARAV